MLAGGDGGLEVIRMEVGRRRDVDGVDVLAREQLLVGLEALEHVGGIDEGLAELLRERAELSRRSSSMLSWKMSPIAVTTRARVLQERRGDGGAATAAAEQAEADGRVGLRAEDGAGFQDREPGRGGGRQPDELAAADLGVVSNRSCLSLLATGPRCRILPPTSHGPISGPRRGRPGANAGLSRARHRSSLPQRGRTA